MKYQPPVLLKSEPDVHAEESLYYEVASNGIFKVHDTALYRAVTLTTRDVPGLYPSRERLEMRFPPLPGEPLEEVLAFFAAGGGALARCPFPLRLPFPRFLRLNAACA